MNLGVSISVERIIWGILLNRIIHNRQFLFLTSIGESPQELPSFSPVLLCTDNSLPPTDFPVVKAKPKKKKDTLI